MSHAALTLAWARRGLPTSAKFVLTYLAFRANGGGQAWPSTGTIAAETGLDARTVFRALSDLEMKGFLKREGGIRKSTVYSLATSGVAPEKTPGTTPEDDHAPLAPRQRTPGTTPEPSEPRREPRKEKALSTKTPAEPQPSLPLNGEGERVNGHSVRAAQEPTAGFDVWWQAYPRKKAKGDAFTAYAKAIKAGASPKKLLDALHAATWSSDRQYIPHPSTWLNGRRWEDEAEDAEALDLGKRKGI